MIWSFGRNKAPMPQHLKNKPWGNRALGETGVLSRTSFYSDTFVQLFPTSLFLTTLTAMLLVRWTSFSCPNCTRLLTPLKLSFRGRQEAWGNVTKNVATCSLRGLFSGLCRVNDDSSTVCYHEYRGPLCRRHWSTNCSIQP